MSRVHHILGSGKVHQVPLTHDGDEPTHSANIFKVLDNGPKIEDPKYWEYLQFCLDEYSKDVLSGNVPRTAEFIVRGPFGYAPIFKNPEAVPKHQRPFPHLGERGEALGEIMKRNLHVRGWLEEVSGGSDWSSPPFTVPEPVPADSPLLDKWRLVIDFRYPNSQTREDQAPLPLIEDMLEKHESHRIFSVLDLKHGFHQMPLHPDDRYLTAMPTPFGTLQWKVLPMGVKNGPAQFQRLMDWILQHRRLDKKDEDGNWKFVYDPLKNVSIYIDDLILGSPDIHSHFDDLRQLLESLRNWFIACGGQAKDENQLFVTQVEFCGQILSNGTQRPSPGAFMAIEKWPRPQTVTQLRSFLGVCNFYHVYIRNYAHLAAPLQDVLKVGKQAGRKGSKVKVNWCTEHDASFQALKDAVCGIRDLRLYEPDHPFYLRCDASDVAVEAALQQYDRVAGNNFPIGFWSRKPTEGQQKWTPREKDLGGSSCMV